MVKSIWSYPVHVNWWVKRGQLDAVRGRGHDGWDVSYLGIFIGCHSRIC